MNAVVVVFDRLGAGYLGPYGNTWIETPGFNRLAAQSAVLDFALSDSLTLESLYRSYWSGQHALQHRPEQATVAATLACTPVHTALITDEPVVADFPLADEFNQKLTIQSESPSCSATDISRTQCGGLFATVIEWLETAPQPFLLWVHARGCQGAWDAPLEFRQQFAELDEPTATGDLLHPPALDLPPDFDPDQVLPILHAYAGQVMLLDMCLSGLLEFLESRPQLAETLLSVTSTRGFPMAEHRRVGGCDRLLHAESIHVPWFVRLPGNQNALERYPGFVQPNDLGPTLLNWFQLSSSATHCWGQSLLASDHDRIGRDRAAIATPDGHAFRTPAWFYRRHADEQIGLYAKPDDRWEANEVSDLCPDIVELMVEHYASYRDAIQRHELELPALPEELTATSMI